jgi:hypothetical protein
MSGDRSGGGRLLQKSTLILPSLLAGLLAAGPVVAATPGEFVTLLAGRTPGAGKTFACFTHVYDEAHLAAHPGQNVAALRVLAVVYSRLDYAYQLRIGVELRGAQKFSTVAECGDGNTPNNIKRAAICAGIGGEARLAIENKNTIQVTLPATTELWREVGAPPGKSVKNAFGEDDRHFRLTRTHLADCDGEAIGEEEKTLLDKDR